MSGDYDRFGAYRIYECLGAGGMATVHRAELDLEDGSTCEVALKRLLPQLADDKRFVEDFVREAKLAAQLNHPNIIRILELGRVRRTYFIAMELVRGNSLMGMMRRAHLLASPAPIGVVVSIAREVCAALEYAHDSTDELQFPRRIIHRDLTPSNVLVTDEGHVKIIDFGVAKALSGQFMTSSGLAKGKLGYMSLEAIGCLGVDARADIFSLGVVLWELLTSRRLFDTLNEDELLAMLQAGDVRRPSSLREDCPSELDEILLRALARDPGERWPSAAAMARELSELMRYYRERATPHEVALWKDQLYHQPLPVPGSELDHDSTFQQVGTDAIGVLGELSVSVRSDDVPFDPVELGVGAAPTFECDTIINNYATRERAQPPDTNPELALLGQVDAAHHLGIRTDVSRRLDQVDLDDE